MATTVTLDDDLIERAAELTGERDPEALLRLALGALVERLAEEQRDCDAFVDANAEMIRERLKTQREEYVGFEDAFAEVRARLRRNAKGDDAA